MINTTDDYCNDAPLCSWTDSNINLVSQRGVHREEIIGVNSEETHEAGNNLA